MIIDNTFALTIVSGIFVAAATGLVGSFLVIRKMTLLSDALSHVALPGIALGVIFHFEPLLGGLITLFLGVLLIWSIEERTKLAIESITGVIFTTALALGSLLIPEEELLETFFGNVSKITFAELILQMFLSLLIIILILKYLKPLILTSIAPELGSPLKISERGMKLLLMLLIALTITIGIGFVGVLLMSSLTIIPASTARNLTKSLKGFFVVSVILAIMSLTGGLIMSEFLPVAPGISAVLLSAFFFLLSLFKK